MNIIEKLKPFMFTKENVKQFPNIIIKTPKKKEKVMLVKKNSDIFVPRYSDTLFWCFYIIENDWSEYYMVGRHHFQIEKNKKISYIEKIRTLKEKLKVHKFKIAEIENDLLNNRCIQSKTFIALCILHNINVIVIYNHYYYEYMGGEGDPYVIRQEKKEFGLCLKKNVHAIKEELSSYWKIENIHKPLKGISTYKVGALKKICKKLKIDMYKDASRMHNKTQLYNLIRLKIE